MFEHEYFDKYSFDEIPIGSDLYMMYEIYFEDYEKSFLEFFDDNEKEYKHIGYVSYIAVRKIHTNFIELSFYGNTSTRFHEISINLYKENFVYCVGSDMCDEKPHIFVKSEWLRKLYMKSYSIFSLIDMIGVKKALENNSLNREKLITFRDEIDTLSDKYQNISFISYADNIVLKSNWSLNFKNNQQYNYEPEVFLEIINKIKVICKNTFNLDIYAVIAQGSNEYYDDALLHISKTENHISLNSFGVPFAQLLEIESAAKKNLDDNRHIGFELYLDEQYFSSLQYKFMFDKNKIINHQYESKILNRDCTYYCTSLKEILNALEKNNTNIEI